MVCAPVYCQLYYVQCKKVKCIDTRIWVFWIWTFVSLKAECHILVVGVGVSVCVCVYSQCDNQIKCTQRNLLYLPPLVAYCASCLNEGTHY